MDMSPIENSVSGVWEDDEFTTPKDGINAFLLAPRSTPSIFGLRFASDADAERDRELLASIKVERERKLIEEMGSTVISRDELGKQLPKLFDCVLDNLLKHPVMPRKELVHMMISQFVEQGAFDQQLTLMLEQAAADWIKEKEKMSSTADVICVTRIPESMHTGFSSSQAE